MAPRVYNFSSLYAGFHNKKEQKPPKKDGRKETAKKDLEKGMEIIKRSVNYGMTIQCSRPWKLSKLAEWVLIEPLKSRMC